METNQDGDKIIGKWRSAARDSEMEFFKTGDTYSAKLLNGWGFGVLTTDDKDIENPDVTLRKVVIR